MIYLDSLASFPLLPEVYDAMCESLKEDYANPSASHLLGTSAQEKIENVRAQIADRLEAFPSEIIFTSGATESNNLILKAHVERALAQGNIPHLITSAIEHKCILAICKHLESKGCEVTYLAPNNKGVVSPESVRKAIRENTILVSLMHVNNELGTINPIREYGKICFENEVAFHTDAAQSFLKTALDVEDDFIDALSLSAHKIGGPKGIGVAYFRDLRNKDLQPVIHGAGQELGIRGGTLATPLIVGFGAAVENFEPRYEKAPFDLLKTNLLDLLKSHGIEYYVNGEGQTLDSCLSITLPNIDVDGLLRSTKDIYSLSQSSACSAGSIEPSHVLSALGFDRARAAKTLRISFSFYTQAEEISKLVKDISYFREG
ncbi:cysteine desulfurase [Pseudidiomarina sp. 1APP75-32.1]|uniref:cysteine desulfurase n=1 Tax=Pseudidiomarina terrestris TaxID=2820060 RepID=A0AAW7R2X1_9GAMM|nr:cysteine desulfurase family protein [Pseudidiomarina sp. 1APP75-32.1]MDN7124864.1 cysteine desulfurase [Pseudidiomarina sp. 1APP75-32.1]